MTDDGRPTHLDLFSGIGGFAVASERAGFRAVCFCERDEFCRSVLAHHWPHIPIINDIRECNGGDIKELVGGSVDLISGGFP